ncbi:MAG: diguanylate cyclase [Gammaproteobacteria bacterium]
MNIEFNFDELKMADRLPSPSGTALAIINLVQQENSTVQQVARLVQADPALSGRILRFVNSAAFGARRPIANIENAVVMLGMQSIRNFALSLSLIGSHREGRCESFNYPVYWAESLLLAVSAAAISARQRIVAPEEAFTLGLLADIGSLALATAWPDIYSECLNAAHGERLLKLEREQFVTDHEELSILIIKDWGLPSIFLEALEKSRLRTQTENSRVDRFARQLLLARKITHYCLADRDLQTAMLPELRHEARQHGIEDQETENFMHEILDQWHEWGKIIEVRTTLPKVLNEVETGFRILLVDDDPILLASLSRRLHVEGHRIDVCSDGETAMQRILEQPAHMVITDWHMQPTDGLTLCRSLRSTAFGKNLYLIMLTASESEDAMVEALGAGIDDYVTKPVNLKVLLARIRAGQRIIELQQELWRERKEIERASAELALANRRLKRIALTDLLTGLPNRRYALARLEQEWKTAQRFNQPLSVLLLDLDYFKSINDSLGHHAGDIALQHAARIISSAKRAGDIACRLGGEEFLVIAGNTDGKSAFSLAERIRKAIEKIQPVKLSLSRPMTVSIGVAGSNATKIDWKELINMADQAMYKAKQNGRNGVQLAAV